MFDGHLAGALIVRSIESEQRSWEEDGAGGVLAEGELQRSLVQRFIGEVVPGVGVPPEDAGEQSADGEAEEDLRECDALILSEVDEVAKDEQIGELRNEECEEFPLTVIVDKQVFQRRRPAIVRGCQEVEPLRTVDERNARQDERRACSGDEEKGDAEILLPDLRDEYPAGESRADHVEKTEDRGKEPEQYCKAKKVGEAGPLAESRVERASAVQYPGGKTQCPIQVGGELIGAGRRGRRYVIGPAGKGDLRDQRRPRA